jgi:hypothetical protein
VPTQKQVHTQEVGPWTGGLNFSSNRDLSPYLSPNELGSALNVQLTPEGFIEARPGFKSLDVDFNTGSPTITILGTINIASEYVTVVQVRTTDTKIYYVRGNKTAVLKATMPLANNFTSVLTLRNSEISPVGDTQPRGVFLFSGDIVNGCYRLEEVPNVTSVATPVLMSSNLKIPRSDFSFAVKDRTFLVDKVSSTIYWSATFEFSLYFNENDTTPEGLATGYVQLEPSVDGSDNITSVEFLNNNFYLFKKSAAFIYTYQADPENDGYLRKFNDILGAFDSTVFRNTVVVINNRGVFTVEGTEFIDIQQKLNLRYETPLDNRSSGSGFISNMNNRILIGFKNANSTQEHHFVLTAANRGWTEWDFDYAEETLASPGSNGYFTQDPQGNGIIIFTTFDKTRVVYTDWKPLPNIYDYQLDGTKTRDSENTEYTRYIPKVDIQAKTLLGDSILDYKKILRSYVRLYISDLPFTTTQTTWVFSINYNNYYFVSTNPSYILQVQPPKTDVYGNVLEENQFPAQKLIPIADPISAPFDAETEGTLLYRRTYQIPMPMHRVKEYTFQLKREFTKLVDIIPVNGSPDRPVQAGYYFLLSGFWAKYTDKRRI